MAGGIATASGPLQTVLHAGCGPARREDMPPGFQTPGWREIRYDIDAAAAPGIQGSITDMSRVASGSVDALYNSHVIEHLYPHEVPVALAEFHRVLKRDGFVVLTCPDQQSVAEQVASGKLMEPAWAIATRASVTDEGLYLLAGLHMPRFSPWADPSAALGKET